MISNLQKKIDLVKTGRKQIVAITMICMAGLLLILGFLFNNVNPGNTTPKDEAGTVDAVAVQAYNSLLVLGQPDLNQTMFNRVVANRGFLTNGVHIDTQGRIYVFDSGNNRILGFRQMGTATSNADIVLGQPSLYDKSAANGNNTVYTMPTASTLALIPYPNVPSPLESPHQSQMATDQAGNFYVLDPHNNRVLKYNDPFNTDTIADEVWGQPNMTTRQSHCGQTGFPVNATGFCTNAYGTAVEIDSFGNLWVTDSGNNRVLRFPLVGGTISKTANLVLGQPNFTSNTAKLCSSTDLTNMHRPLAIKFHPVTGDLYVEQGQVAGENSVFIYKYPFTLGQKPIKEIGRAITQTTQPADTTGWLQECEVWAQVSTGLHWARGMAFSPTSPTKLYLNDGSNHRILILDPTTGAKLGAGLQPDTSTTNCTANIMDCNGNITNLCLVLGEPAFDSAGNLYLASGAGGTIHRFPTPLTRDSQQLTHSNGCMLYQGYNATTGKTFSPPFGMSKYLDSTNSANDQLYSVEISRVLVFNNPGQLSNYATADYVIGQDSMDETLRDVGIFAGHTLNDITVGKEQTTNTQYMWVSSGYDIYAFPLPINHSGKDYVPTKVLTSGNNLRWADDNSLVNFASSGLLFDENTNSLWISDTANSRVLRVHDPLSPQPKVDLVLGQPNKSSTCDNGCLGSTNAKGIGNPWTLNFDKLGNLYVTDSGYEGWMGGTNNRIMRFNATDLVPNTSNPNPIFPFPAASGVYGKPSLTSGPYDNAVPNVPHHPVSVAFNSENRMLLLADSYGNPQYERAFLYSANHTSQVAPQPASILPIPFGQPAEAFFYKNDSTIFVQDLTWQRILKLSWGTLPASCQQTGKSWCSNHGGIALAVDHDVANWAQCLSWCNQNMTTSQPLCQYNGDNPRGCWVNYAPSGGIANCDWLAGNPAPYGACLASYVTPTPSPIPTNTPKPTITPKPTPKPSPGLATCQSQTGHNFCVNHGAQVKQITSTTANWSDCLSWCNLNMTANAPICFYLGYGKNCWIYKPPAAGIKSCTWRQLTGARQSACYAKTVNWDCKKSQYPAYQGKQYQTCNTTDGNLYKCVNNLAKMTTCAAGCTNKPPGKDDTCK